MYCPECKSYTLFTFPCKVPDFGFCKECEYVWSREIDGDEKKHEPATIRQAIRDRRNS
jgi:transposase-like protein